MGADWFNQNLDTTDLSGLKDVLCDYKVELSAALKGNMPNNVLVKMKRDPKPFEAMETLLDQLSADKPKLHKAFYAFMERNEELAPFLKKRGMSVLSLDGGGFRGYATLIMLEQLLPDQRGPNPVKPCEVFDLICGTSTGGLIAIMLGRLKMSVPEAKTAFLNLGPLIFGNDRKVMGVLLEGSKFDANLAEKAFRDLIKSKTGSEDALLADPESSDVFVTTVDTKNVAATRPIMITSYEPPVEAGRIQVPPDHKWTCVQAARATSAAPTYFDPLVIGDYSFQDAGGSGFNNPADIAYEEKEAMEKYNGLPIKLFVSLGTGLETLCTDTTPAKDKKEEQVKGAIAWLRKKASVYNDVKENVDRLRRTAENLVGVATNTSATALTTEKRFDDTKGVYWRFQPSQGLGDLDLADYEHAHTMNSIVGAYFMGPARASSRACSEAIAVMKEIKQERAERALAGKH